ncbi:MAG: oxygen-independent coproporphyrinogen III oxidase [Candidatus Eisenbacteria bacterium]|nr:oxygen-independent coproporphyrinogen III oxidase [Candidatus Eisenbacteria bacterium]
MSEGRYTLDIETLQKFDRPGPRYTSYPTAVEFHDGVGDEDYEKALAEVNESPQDSLAAYIHLPFCEERCTFCGCHVIATQHREVADKYLDYLDIEIGRVAELLPDRRGLAQVHLGGGTPTYLTPSQLERLWKTLTSRFHLLDGAEVAIEVDPRVTKLEHLDTLGSLGFNRLSMGVQDFTEDVQDAIGRHQSYEQTQRVLEHARKVGFHEGINIDLVYGLPRQTEETFLDGLSKVASLRPDRLAVYSFAYVPWIRGNQRKIDTDDLPSADLKLRLYLAALNHFIDHGYDPIGMDHFALPDDELAVAQREGRLARNFMGYTVKPAKANLGFGVSSIGDIPAGYFQNMKKLSTYYERIDQGGLPIEKGFLLSDDDRLRRWVITQVMCNFQVKKAEVQERFGVDFDSYFADALAALAELEGAGFVSRDEDALRITDAGKLLVRNAAMVFDAYMGKKDKSKPVFSRTV